MQNEVDWGLGMLLTKPEVIDKRRKICVKFEVFFVLLTWVAEEEEKQELKEHKHRCISNNSRQSLSDITKYRCCDAMVAQNYVRELFFIQSKLKCSWETWQ